MDRDLSLGLILTRVAAGDRSALEELIKLTRPRLLAFAIRLLGDQRDCAEDVVQDTYLRVGFGTHSQRSGFESPWGYLLTTVRHTVYDTSRKKNREDKRIEAVRSESETATYNEFTESSAWTELRSILSPDDAMLLDLLRSDESARDIAARLAISEQAYAQRRHRLLRKLRQYVVLKELSRTTFEDT